MDNWKILHYALKGAVQRREIVQSLRNMVASGDIKESTCPASDLTEVLAEIAEIKRLIQEDEKERYGFVTTSDRQFKMFYDC